MATITTVKERIAQLNQASFQILCDALLAREGYSGIVALGTEEGKEKTTPGTPDTYFCTTEGKYIFAEYTTQQKGLIAKIRLDIDKCLDEGLTGIPLYDIAEIIYCHTSSNIRPVDDRDLKIFCEEKGIKLTIMGVDSLAEKLMNYPAIIKDHLGLTIDSEQIQTIEDFVRQYNCNSMSATLGTDFLFREKEFDQINKAFDSVNVVLLVGPAGVGKTRLALEYAKHHANTRNEKLLCIHNRSLPIYEDLKVYFEKPGEYFIVIDDANQLSEIEHVIEYVNKADLGYTIRILMTVRDYAVSKVKLDLSGVVYYETVSITPFTDEEISSLMKNHYGILNQVYLDRIVQIAEGNARIAMLTGKIACESNRLDSIYDVSDVYSNYYGTALQEAGVNSNNRLLIAAGIMAFLNSIHLDYIDPIMPILESKAITIKDFIEDIHLLHEQEIVDICNDKGVRFSEQCMANYILKHVYVDKRIISLSAMIEACFGAYRERTVDAVNTLLGVFQNSELHDFVRKEILELWEKLEIDDSPVFLDFLRAFFPVNELKTLLIIQNRIDKIAPMFMRPEDINTEEGKNYQNISDDIITILGGFSYSENLDAALDLFFQYYLKRPDLYMQFYHATTSFFSIDKHSAEHSYKTQILFFTKMMNYSQNGGNEFISVLFSDIASHFLMLEFSPYENIRSGKGITLFRIPLAMSQGVREYRRLVWEYLLVLASKESYKQNIKRILRKYGNAIYDCSKDVILFDEDYIWQLSQMILSPEYLEDCLIVQSLQKVFEVAGQHPKWVRLFNNCEKYRLYQTICGPKWDLDITFDERKKKKEDGIRAHILSTTKKPEMIRDIVDLFVESNGIENGNSYELAEGIDTAFQTIEDDKDNYIKCSTLLFSAKTINGINIKHIVKTLFCLISPHEVLNLIIECSQNNRNDWLFAYYYAIPQDLINQDELNGLYRFLMDESDRDIQSSSYRDISFLDKYLTLDDDVIITASKIILKKKEYSPFMVSLYFGPQFNEYNIHPNEVILKFKKDITLLEQIYICLSDFNHHIDYHGSFLSALFDADKSFVKVFAEWFVKKAEKEYIAECRPIIKVFLQEENYLDALDYIVDKSIASASFPTMIVPRIIKLILDPLNDQDNDCLEKKDCWIKHYIDMNCTKIEKIGYLFEALSEISIERAREYIVYLVECNDNYAIFEAIPLTPLSYSWSGSSVPLYSSWVEQLEQLLPCFSGLKFIKHKARVQQVIESYRNRIKAEEIADIING